MSNNHVAQTHLPTAAGLTGLAGCGHAQQDPGVRRARCGDCAGTACPFEAVAGQMWKLNRTL